MPTKKKQATNVPKKPRCASATGGGFVNEAAALIVPLALYASSKGLESFKASRAKSESASSRSSPSSPASARTRTRRPSARRRGTVGGGSCASNAITANTSGGSGLVMKGGSGLLESLLKGGSGSAVRKPHTGGGACLLDKLMKGGSAVRKPHTGGSAMDKLMKGGAPYKRHTTGHAATGGGSFMDKLMKRGGGGTIGMDHRTGGRHQAAELLRMKSDVSAFLHRSS